MIGLLPTDFWAKVNKDGPVPEHRPDLGPCWLWTGAKQSLGYGTIGGGTDKMLAHHVLVGKPPKGLEYDHLCRIRNCVRPDHLELVTHAENVRRGLRGQLVTHCPKGHAYTPENTRYWQNRRKCRACHRAREAQRTLRRTDKGHRSTAAST